MLILFYLTFFLPLSANQVQTRTNATLYENPFDLAAGGASLTRATQEGVTLNNPSLSAFGTGIFRWIYQRQAIHIGADSVDLVRQGVKDKNSFGANPDTLNTLLKTPIHLGPDVALGAITSPFSLGALSTNRVDLRIKQFGQSGTPEVHAQAYSHTMGIAASSKLLTNWLAVGANVKYIYGLGVNERISLLDLMGEENVLDDVKNRVKMGQGIAIDAATTFQLQTKNFDLRLAVVSTDVTNTKFRGNIETWKRAYHTGLGIVPHLASSAMHCAVDYRDITGVYKEHWTLRTYAGCKLLIQKTVGFGAGLYHGYPSMGVVVNALIARIEAGMYTREMGSQVGVDGRKVYFIAFGFEL